MNFSADTCGIYYQTTCENTGDFPFFCEEVFTISAGICQKPFHRFFIQRGQKIEERFIGQAYVFPEQEAFGILNESYRCGPSVHEVTQKFYDKVKIKMI